MFVANLCTYHPKHLFDLSKKGFTSSLVRTCRHQWLGAQWPGLPAGIYIPGAGPAWLCCRLLQQLLGLLPPGMLPQHPGV